MAPVKIHTFANAFGVEGDSLPSQLWLGGPVNLSVDEKGVVKACIPYENGGCGKCPDRFNCPYPKKIGKEGLG